MTSIPNPPVIRGTNEGGPVIVQGRLSDLAPSGHDLLRDLVLPPLRVAHWRTIGNDRELLRAAVALQALRLAHPPDAIPNEGAPRTAVQQLITHADLTDLEAAFARLEQRGDLDHTLDDARELIPVVREVRSAEFHTVLDESADIARFLYGHYRDDAAARPPLRPWAIETPTPWFSVRDQGNRAGCVGFALADLVQLQRADRLDVPSARFIWQAGKELDAEPGPTTMIAGAGTSLRAGLEVLRSHGCPSETELSSDGPHLFHGSLDAFNRMTRARQIVNFVNLGRDIKYRLAWLSRGRPIVCGLVAGSNFLRARGPEVIQPDALRTTSSFGHAVVIVGYRIRPGSASTLADIRRTIERIDEPPHQRQDLPIQYLLRNAAGQQWGDGGYGWIEHAAFLDHITEDYGIFCTEGEFSDSLLEIDGERRPRELRARRRAAAAQPVAVAAAPPADSPTARS